MPARRRTSQLAVVLLLALGDLLVLGGAPSRAEAAFACTDASNLCLGATDGAAWEPGAASTSADRRKRSKSGGKLSLTIEGGRGSLFVNGRYAGTAPLDGIDILAGKNDIQVRDGEEVLAKGLLTVPAGSNLTITVRHP